MTHQLLPMMVGLILIGTFGEVVLSLFFSNANTMCPTTSVTQYSHNVIFDSFTGQSQSEEDEYGGVSPGTMYVTGQQGSILAGQTLGQIDVLLSANDLGSGVAHDKISVGVFNEVNGQPLKIFGVMYGDSIPTDNVKRFYNFTIPAGYVLPSQSVIGTLVQTQANGDKSGKWVDYNNQFDVNSTHNLIQWVGWKNNTGMDSNNYNNVTNLSYVEVLKDSQGSTIFSNVCNGDSETTQKLYFVIPIILIVVLILLYVMTAIRDRD